MQDRSVCLLGSNLERLTDDGGAASMFLLDLNEWRRIMVAGEPDSGQDLPGNLHDLSCCFLRAVSSIWLSNPPTPQLPHNFLFKLATKQSQAPYERELSFLSSDLESPKRRPIFV